MQKWYLNNSYHFEELFISLQKAIHLERRNKFKFFDVSCYAHFKKRCYYIDYNTQEIQLEENHYSHPGVFSGKCF